MRIDISRRTGGKAHRKAFRMILAGVATSLLVVLGVADPAQADSEIPGSRSDFSWNGYKSFPFCYAVYKDLVTVDCDPITIGEVKFDVKMTLNGTRVDVQTSWQVTSGEQELQMFSLVECRKDEFVDDSCGSAGGQGYAEWARSGSLTDSFILGTSGKYFFDLQYAFNVLNAPVGPPGDMVDAFIGTSHRIKCTPKKEPWYCEMA